MLPRWPAWRFTGTSSKNTRPMNVGRWGRIFVRAYANVIHCFEINLARSGLSASSPRSEEALHSAGHWDLLRKRCPNAASACITSEDESRDRRDSTVLHNICRTFWSVSVFRVLTPRDYSTGSHIFAYPPPLRWGELSERARSGEPMELR